MVNEQFLSEMKEKLMSEKTQLEEKLARIGKRTAGEDGKYTATWQEIGDKEEDNASEVEEYSTSLGLGQTFETDLQQVLLALKRIEDGVYGACEHCGALIDENRLRIRPMSRFCMECAEEVER
jgi:RNA polymerase-binding transcription factor DksA